MDPYIAEFSSEIKTTFKRHSSDLTILKKDGLATNLYEVLQKKTPKRLLLSPLLASETPALLTAFPDLQIGFVGALDIAEHERLYTVQFSEARAAVQAAIAIAAYCKKLSPEPAVVALLLPEENSQTIAEAFNKAFQEAGRNENPRILSLSQEFSPDAVASVKNTDVRAAYIALPGRTGAQYKKHLFTKATFIVALQPLGNPEDPLDDIALSWDFNGALDDIKNRMDKKKSGKEYLAWKETKLRTN